MKEDWTKLRPVFFQLVNREGAEKVADVIPTHVRTVQRLVSGDTQKPTRAVLAAIQRIVENDAGIQSN